MSKRYLSFGKCKSCGTTMATTVLGRHEIICVDTYPLRHEMQRLWNGNCSLRAISDEINHKYGLNTNYQTIKGLIDTDVSRNGEPPKLTKTPKHDAKCSDCGVKVYNSPNVKLAMRGQQNHNGYCAMCAGKMAKDYHSRYGVAGAIIAHEPTVKYNFVSPRGYII